MQYMLLYCTFVTCKILSTLIYKSYSSDYPIRFDAKASYPYQQSNFALQLILDDEFPLYDRDINAIRRIH